MGTLRRKRGTLRDIVDEQGFAVLDGGLASTLEARRVPMDPALWSGLAVRDNPDELRSTHIDFFAAGADVVTTASYQMSFEGFASHGLSRGEAIDLLRRSAELAVQARDLSMHSLPPSRLQPMVAASVGTYAAHLADGSEYTGRLGRTSEQLEAWHRDKFSILASSGADALACETVPCLEEVKALVRLLESPPHAAPAGNGGGLQEEAGGVDISSSWLSLACRRSSHGYESPDQLVLNSGESLEDAIRSIEDPPAPAAPSMAAAASARFGVGVNCVDPRITLSLIEEIREFCHSDRLIVVYPNSGEAWDAVRSCWCSNLSGGTDFCSETAGPVAAMVRGWRDAGANVIGSCCRTGPETTRLIRKALLVHDSIEQDMQDIAQAAGPRSGGDGLLSSERLSLSDVDSRSAADDLAIAVAVAEVEEEIKAMETFSNGNAPQIRRRRVTGKGGDAAGAGSEKGDAPLSPEEIQELLRPREEDEDRATAVGMLLGFIILIVLISFAYSYVMIFKMIFK